MKTLLPEINSADKRFHAGNPATGEQGTRVTDTWLNDVQDRVRDMQAEAHYVLEKAGFTPKQEQQTQLYQAIVKIIDDNRKKASTTQKGEVQLTSDTGLDSEELGLTAKAGKKLAQMIAVVQLALNNYIPLNKRSSSVNSNDENNVATSKAVKTAYDKGIEAKIAADNAQQSAESANTNANSRVAKSGDTMTGDLSLKQGDYSGINLYKNDGYYTRLEGNPNNHSSLLTLVYRTPKGENIAVATLPKKNGVIAYAGDVVSKSGDSMSGTLSFSGATDSYRIGSYTWRMPIKFSGDAVIGNEKCVIGFNNNGALHLGGLPDASQFKATLDGEKFWVAGDVKTALGRSLNKAHQNDFNFVSVKQSDGLGGLHINRQDGKSARFEYNNGRFKLWNEGKYDMYFPDKGGTLALTSDVVSDVRLGALVTKRLFRDLNSEGAVGAGYIVTGFRDIGDRFDNATGVFRPIQKHINGQWITISNA